MKKIKLGKSDLSVPAIAIGCMRMKLLDEKTTETYVHEALELGANFFDHADVYGAGRSEELFGNVLKNTPSLRDQMILQSKCGIVPGRMYDFSKEHILTQVDQSLKRLHTDHLDLLVLHRPDALMEPEEVAEAFDSLKASGKVGHFGVSNHHPLQIQLLQKYLNQDLLVNQLQLSLTESTMISTGMETNTTYPGGINRDGYVLDFCRLNDITIQAWSPFQFGHIEGTFIGHPDYPKLNETLNALAEKYNLTPAGIVTAWMLRHPANIQMIAGTMNIDHLKEILAASDVRISREEWYRLYLDAGHMLP